MNVATESFDVDLMQGPRLRGAALVDDFNRLRDAAPVHWSDRSHCWILTRHQDVADMLMGRLPLQNGGRASLALSAIPEAERAARLPNLSVQVPLWIVSADGARHSRLRTMLMKSFNRQIVEAARDNARDRANQLLDALAGRDGFEFNEEFARAMAGYVLLKAIGLPEALLPSLQEWAIAIMEAFGGAGVPTPAMLDRAEAAAAAMNAAVAIELDKRRDAPRNDLLTTLLQASEEEGENGLTRDEIFAQMHVVIVAGHDTTANTMTLGVEALSRHRQALDHIRRHPERIDASVAEIQRYVAMSAGQKKVATEDFELHGHRIRKGDLVVAAIMAADRDPLKLDDPETLDLARDNRRMMVFAPGPRACLGQMLAKMQLGEFFTALARRVERIELLDDELAWMPVFSFRGVYQLNVRLHALRQTQPAPEIVSARTIIG